jgi:branched-subunit amino acid aminotransferase/4-amino-4-deoxychorismate lyase
MHVWLNGTFVDRDEAVVSVFDAGFQHGVGLFETMLARNGRLFRPADHMERLAGSARDLLLTTRLKTAALVDAAQLTVARNQLAEARVRLTITGGNLNLLQSDGSGPADPTILIVAQPATRYPDGFFDEGVTVRIADGRENPLSLMAGHKTLNYWPRIHALQQTAKGGGSEAIWFTVSNHLSSGSVSNVLLVKDGGLLTPIARGEEEPGALASTVLPGITRRTVTGLADDRGIATTRGMLDIDDLLSADEVFLTNSSWGVLPVVAVERERIGDGAVGPITRTLREAWLECVDEETSTD